MADLGFLEGGDFGNPTRSEGVWTYGRILCICKLPQRSLGRSPNRNRIWGILALNVPSGGKNFNDFPDNQLTKFRLV